MGNVYCLLLSTTPPDREGRAMPGGGPAGTKAQRCGGGWWCEHLGSGSMWSSAVPRRVPETTTGSWVRLSGGGLKSMPRSLGFNPSTMKVYR